MEKEITISSRCKFTLSSKIKDSENQKEKVMLISSSVLVLLKKDRKLDSSDCSYIKSLGVCELGVTGNSEDCNLDLHCSNGN